MGKADFWNNPNEAKEVTRERRVLMLTIGKYDAVLKDLEEAEVLELLAEEENDASAAKESEAQLNKVADKVRAMEFEIMLGGEHDLMDAIISINSGAGGTEAQDWAEMLLRMYLRWAERRGFKSEIIEILTGQEAGIQNVTIEVRGAYAYGFLRSEIGVHRLVRLSPFDAAHRRHTSFASVFVIPDIEEEIDIEISEEDLRIDTYRAGGHGGQKVNKTDSAVRITHLPTGIAVQCQNERSQHKNKATAMRVLKARLYQLEEEKKAEEMNNKFHLDKKDIDFGSQIRSYVLHPYRMVKDHRTASETGNADAVLDGEIDQFIQAYLLK